MKCALKFRMCGLFSWARDLPIHKWRKCAWQQELILLRNLLGCWTKTSFSQIAGSHMKSGSIFYLKLISQYQLISTCRRQDTHFARAFWTTCGANCQSSLRVVTHLQI